MIDEWRWLRRFVEPRTLVAGIAAGLGVGVGLTLVALWWGAVGLAVGVVVVALALAAVVAAVVVRLLGWLRRRLHDVDERFDRELDDRDRRLADMERQLQALTRRDVAGAADRATQLAAAGELDDAAAAFEEALDLDANDPEVRLGHRRVLRSLHEDGDATRSYIAAIRRRIAVGHHEHARELAEDAFEANLRSLRVRDLLVSLYDLAGETERALELAVDTAQHRIRRLDRLRPETEVERTLAPEQRTFVSGFFYSGSGAVVDHLRGLEGVQRWPPVKELRLIKFPGGFADLAGRHAERAELRAQDLVDLYLHLTGWKITHAPRGTYDTWGVVNRNSRQLFRLGAPAAGYLAVCLRAFVELSTQPLASWSTADLEGYFRDWLKRALDAAATDTEADHLVVDQAVTAWRLELANLVPPSNFVLVHRDPRDQYTEVRDVLDQPGRSAQRRDPRDFADRYRRDRRAAEAAIPRLERDADHRVLQVSFEEFVIDHEAEAARIAEHLALTGRASVERHFRAEESRANVGKHRDALGEADREILQRELGEYLHPYAGDA